MAIYQVIFSICLIVGSAAAPYSTVHVDGRGTIGTCTAQGFLLYVGFDVVHLYYCMFSFYFYVAIKNDFDLAKVKRVETYIHLFVPMYPLCTGIYLLIIGGFNYGGYGFCFVGSSPLMCEVSVDVPCERGTSKHGVYLFIHTVCVAFILIFPPIMVAYTYWYMKKHKGELLIEANFALVKNFCYYIAGIYWINLPFFLLELWIYTNWNAGPDFLINIYPFGLFAMGNYCLAGLWIVIGYKYYFWYARKLFRRIHQRPIQQQHQRGDDIQEDCSSESS